jgi:hypothetical protein
MFTPILFVFSICLIAAWFVNAVNMGTATMTDILTYSSAITVFIMLMVGI